MKLVAQFDTFLNAYKIYQEKTGDYICVGDNLNKLFTQNILLQKYLESDYLQLTFKNIKINRLLDEVIKNEKL